eukprot:3563761-Pleurochrysis_carterae.AAC.1
MTGTCPPAPGPFTTSEPPCAAAWRSYSLPVEKAFCMSLSWSKNSLHVAQLRSKLNVDAHGRARRRRRTRQKMKARLESGYKRMRETREHAHKGGGKRDE